MRWIKNFLSEGDEPELGDERIRSGFLWLPKAVRDRTRWLVRATWRERYVWTGRGTRERKAWRGVEWLEEGDVQELPSEEGLSEEPAGEEGSRAASTDDAWGEAA